MSYARFGKDSDVYVYAGGKGYECCGCINLNKTQGFTTSDELIEHLQIHQIAGHKVPGYTFYEIGVNVEQERIIEILKTNFINNELLELAIQLIER
jgi:hypothetical protein